MPQRLVIVGGGFGGAYAAKRLRRLGRGRDLDITLINRTNYFVFYPLLIEAGTGSLEPRHAVVPLRKMIDGVQLCMAEVTDIDLDRRVVQYALTDSDITMETTYDHLLLAPGSVTRFPPVPGLAEHGYEIKSLGDAVALRDRAISLLERANAVGDADLRRRLLHFVIVGANYTGVELAGEFHAFLYAAAKNYANVDRRNDIKVTLVEMVDRILPTLENDLAAYAADQLQRRGVELRLNETLTEIGQTCVTCRSGDALPTETCIWAAGVAPPPIVAKVAGLPTDDRGYIRCQPDLRVEGLDNVWAIGDAASNPDPEGNAYPPTAQHAVQMGTAAADRIVAAIEGRPVEPFAYQARGTVAAIGCRSAVAEVMGLRFSGFFAWWLYRTLYLLKMPGWSRRIRIALDWTIDLLFGRDYIQLGVHRRSRRPA